MTKVTKHLKIYYAFSFTTILKLYYSLFRNLFSLIEICDVKKKVTSPRFVTLRKRDPRKILLEII